MKQFNKTSALRKIKFQKNKNTYIKRLSISLSCLILLFVVMLFTFARFEASSDEYTMIEGKVANICRYEMGHEWTFDYTGNSQEFKVPCNGEYKIELWGSEGNASYDGAGGKGGFTSGKIQLDSDLKLYVFVGGKGSYSTGGYNGGGIAHKSSGTFCGAAGGGATDIRLVNGAWNNFNSLKSRIMVAAAGGGAGGAQPDNRYNQYFTTPGDAGGLSGYASNGSTSYKPSVGGTQTAGGYNTRSSSVTDTYGSFGYGPQTDDDSCCGAGGGSGYYGGGGGCGTSASGGSSFISGYNGCKAITESSTASNIVHSSNANHYSGKIFTNGIMIDGKGCNWSTGSAANCGANQEQPNGSKTVGHSGNGYARIKLLSTTDTNRVNCDNLLGKTWTYSYTGNTQSFSAPCDGNYKMELWGASGGSNRSSDSPGLGGYVSGNININSNDTFYIQVGNKGDTAIGGAATPTYNGGGTTGYYSTLYEGFGGGATDIRVVSGTWNNADSLRSRIMVAAAGGGGGGSYTTYYLNGGHAGGLTGNSGVCTGSCSYSPVTGGNQTSGGYNDHNSLSGSFGVSSLTTSSTGYSGGGGSGWYAGVKGYGTGGSGGSSYISGHTGCVGVTSKTSSSPKSGCTTGTTNKSCSISPYEYEFTNTKIIDGAGYNWTNVKGSLEKMPNPSGGYYANGTGHSGNGYAKITYLSK